MQRSSFELLHQKVQKVVLGLGWRCLYPIQEEAIRYFSQEDSDLVIAAPTSGGKTEAAFLPVLSELMRSPRGKAASVSVLCISPLKALINDQFARLKRLCEPLGITVHRWHGDIDREAKRRLREQPGGILFITPESLESCFINYPHQIQNMFRALECVVLDELHALLETERGMHVRSLLARMEAAIQRRPRYVGLSATLEDPLAVRSFLNGCCELASDGEPAVVLHHGSLSARVRRQTESMLKSGTPTRALCTSSLELGIDIGAVEAVAQIDPTWSVASLVQRLGRSGRTPGSTSQLRLYVRAPALTAHASLVDLLCAALLQAVAMVQLLLGGWLEPVMADRMHLSTLVHQILSVLKETGGQTAVALYHLLCRRGSFRRVEPAAFKRLLQGLRAHGLISQTADGVVFLDLQGERVTSAPAFYAAFSTPVELTVRCGARELGRLPASFALKEGECLLLNGRRWLIENVDWTAKNVWVNPTGTKKAPLFLGGVGETHDRVFEEMRGVLLGTEEPDWLDATSIELLRSARETARRAGLHEGDLLDLDQGVQWFPWVGTRTMRTLQLWAKKSGYQCTKDALSLIFGELSKDDLEHHLAVLAKEGLDAVELAALMPSKQFERFDVYVDEQLLDQANAMDRLDVEGARKAARASARGIVPAGRSRA